MLSLSPNLFVEDVYQTVAFYELLGFQTVMTVPEDGQNMVWAMMTAGNVTMMFQTMSSLGNELPEISRAQGGALLLYIKVDGIRDFFARIEHEITILKGLEKTFYGATEFSIRDNNGYVLTFAEDE